jgi:hypothetical protein
MPMADGAMFVKFHNIIQWKIIIKRGTNIFLLFFLFILHSVRFYSSRTLRDGNCQVFVEKCKYLEESKCLGVCINTCKLPTQTFFKDHMGVDLYMEPNFEDYSCQVIHFMINLTMLKQKLSNKLDMYMLSFVLCKTECHDEAQWNTQAHVVFHFSSTLGCHLHLLTPTKP